MATFNKRYSTAIVNFKGIDYASQRFMIGQDHALNALNFIYRDGVPQKRWGYEQKMKLKPVRYKDGGGAKENGVAVKGLWKLKFKDVSSGALKKYVFAFVGRLLGVIVYVDKKDVKYEFQPFGGQSNGIWNTMEFDDLEQPFGFFGGNRFWFLGGNHYVMVSPVDLQLNGESAFYMEEVAESSKAYIPTTTTGITYRNAKTTARLTLEPTNMLQKYRKNELLSGVGKSEVGVDASNRTKGYEYVLDAPIVVKNRADMSKMTVKIRAAGKVVE